MPAIPVSTKQDSIASVISATRILCFGLIAAAFLGMCALEVHRPSPQLGYGGLSAHGAHVTLLTSILALLLLAGLISARDDREHSWLSTLASLSAAGTIGITTLLLVLSKVMA